MMTNRKFFGEWRDHMKRRGEQEVKLHSNSIELRSTLPKFVICNNS